MANIRDRRDANWFWMNKSLIDDYGDKIGAHGIAVYALLARCANLEGHATPSIRYIGEKLRISTATVQRYLDILATHQLIEHNQRFTAYGDLTSNEYILLTIQGKQGGVAGADTPVAGADTPVAGADTPVAGADTPVAGADTPVAGADTQVYQQLIHGVAAADTEQEDLNKKDLEQRKKTPLTPLKTGGRRMPRSRQAGNLSIGKPQHPVETVDSDSSPQTQNLPVGDNSAVVNEPGSPEAPTKSRQTVRSKSYARSVADDVMLAQAQDVLAYLNAVHHRTFTRATYIRTLLATGVTVEECKLVIDWLYAVERLENPEGYDRYGNNVTPFRPDNFDRYLDRARRWKASGNRIRKPLSGGVVL